MRNDAYVLKGNKCYHSKIEATNNTVEYPDLKLNHREADPRITLHTVFASSTDKLSVVWVVADDTNINPVVPWVSVLLWKIYFHKVYAI